MAGFLLGVGVSAVVVFFALTWREWMEIPKHWREESDRNMRQWFVAIRRIFKGPMPHQRKQEKQ